MWSSRCTLFLVFPSPIKSLLLLLLFPIGLCIRLRSRGLRLELWPFVDPSGCRGFAMIIEGAICSHWSESSVFAKTLYLTATALSFGLPFTPLIKGRLQRKMSCRGDYWKYLLWEQTKRLKNYGISSPACHDRYNGKASIQKHRFKSIPPNTTLAYEQSYFSYCSSIEQNNVYKRFFSLRTKEPAFIELFLHGLNTFFQGLLPLKLLFTLTFVTFCKQR